MIHKIEHSDLIDMVRIIDVRHEFHKEWENDENMIRMFIDLNIGNFLPGDEDTFGSYLTNLMHFKGLTQTVLAERTGISYNTIFKYLSDYGRTKPYTLALMIAFGLEPSQIDAVFSLAELRIDRRCTENNIINRYMLLGRSDDNAVAKCNQALVKFGCNPLTALGTDAYGR